MLKRLMPVMLIYAVLTTNTILAAAQQGKGIMVVVSIDMLRPLVSSILGDVGEVYSIVPEGAEPHGFTINPSIVRNALRSNLIVTTGHMEWENELVQRVAEERNVQPHLISLNLLNLTGVRLLELEEGRNIHGFWLLPDNAILIAYALKNRLSEMRPEYSEYFSSNYLAFQSRVSSLKGFLNRLSEKYGFSEKKVVIGFYEEQYVVEAMGLKVGAVLIGEEEVVRPETLKKIYDGLKSGEYACIVVSDTALLMSGVKAALQQISRDTGCSIAYVSVISTNGLENYDSIMYYNAGQVYSALSSRRENVSNGLNVYLFTTIVALLVIIVETIILVRGRMRA